MARAARRSVPATKTTTTPSPSARQLPKTRLQNVQINTHLKNMKPPTIYGNCICDQIRLALYIHTFWQSISQDDKHGVLERVTHAILIASRLHNAAIENVVLPLLKKIKVQGSLVKDIITNLENLEECAAKIYATQKHVKNAEFIDLMHDLENFIADAMGNELTMLEELIDYYDDEKLIMSADAMDEAKYKASLMPKEI